MACIEPNLRVLNLIIGKKKMKWREMQNRKPRDRKQIGGFQRLWGDRRDE